MVTSPTRIANRLSHLSAALALAAAGCGGPMHGVGPGPSAATPPSASPSSAPPLASATYALTLYWSFARHLPGEPQPVIYDAQPGPSGGGSGSCAQSGVDVVAVSLADGTALTPAGSGVPCVYGGVQGASFAGFTPGTYDVIVTGYRAGHALYETLLRVDVAAGGTNAFDVTVPGIADDLDVFAVFLDASGVESWGTCAAAAVDTLEYQLVDSAGTIVGSGSAPCADPAGISFRSALGAGIDRDTYTIRMRAIDRGAVAFDATPRGCALQSFDHLAADSLAHGWSVGLYVTGTVCR
jgi:hypothetical protein